jgi:hypothetical protein
LKIIDVGYKTLAAKLHPDIGGDHKAMTRLNEVPHAGDIPMMKARLAKLVRMLSSDKDGEVLAAVAAIHRVLQEQGADFHALAAAVERSTLVPQRDDDARSWRATCEWCCDHVEHLNDLEADLVFSLKRWRGQPTEKQMNWLDAIEQYIRSRQAR